MSTHTQVRFGYARFSLFGLILAAAGATGCATSGGAFAHDTSEAAIGVTMVQGTHGMSATSGVRAGEPSVIGGQVNPMVSVRLTVDGNDIAVRFAHPRSGGALVRLDGASLAPLAAETSVTVERAATPSTAAVRTVLADGKFIVCWKAGNAEAGYRLMAQAWTAGGSSLGQPVTISPADMDVLGAPQMATVDGDHAVATFAAMTGNQAELLAVSLQVL